MNKGPGTELKKLLYRWFRIKPSKDCPCNKHAELMDEWGCLKCRQNINEIIGWLKEEAENRGWLFSSTLVKGMIIKAIRTARLQGDCNEKTNEK